MRGKVVFFLTIAVFVGQVRSQRESFRNDYTYDLRTKYFYKEGPKAKAWRSAVFDCEGEGAELAIPSSAAEMLGVVRYMSADTISVWLGINDAKANGKFKMVNGSITAIAFATSGPKNKSCVGMLKNGDYRGYDCNTPRKFVCVKDANSLTSNAGCETYDMNYFYSKDADRCYKLHIHPRNWNNAMKLCVLEGANLVVLNSPTESEIVANILKVHEDDTLWGDFNKAVIHLGFNDFTKTREGFVTNEGKSLADSGFEIWAPGQPAAKGRGVLCGGMLRTGNLTVVNCNERAIFLCEKILGSNHQSSLDIRVNFDD